MCNYEVQVSSASKLARDYRIAERPNLAARYVVRPTDERPVVAIGRDGGRHLVSMRWGLVPPWADDTDTGLTLFNARAETLLEKPVFAGPFTKGHRCVVPTDGFYEFSGSKGAKQPHLFRARGDRPIAFAGLWEVWRGPAEKPLEKPLVSYAIITTTPNLLMAPIHNRMPVLLAGESEVADWLDRDTPRDRLLALLRPPPDDLLETHPVTRDLLRIADPGPEVLKPVLAQPLLI